MSLKAELEAALKSAMRAGDDLRKKTLRDALSALKLAEVEARGELDDADILGILQKEVKSQHEAIADAQKAGREDLIKNAEAQIAVLEEYLPQPLSPEELRALAEEVISEVGAETPGDMGKVMGALMPRVKGRAEGGQVSQVVQDLLRSG